MISMSDSPPRPLLNPALCSTSSEELSPTQHPFTLNITSFQILNPELSSPPSPSPHHIDYILLFAHKINHLHRLKLLKWLHSESVKQGYYRQVFAYAAAYLDRFLSLSPRVALEELQLLAFGALMLATKIQGMPFPKLGSMFDTNQILHAEVRMAMGLNYFLHPRTYVHVLTDLIGQWQSFGGREGMVGGEGYLAQSLIGFQRYRDIFEKMECVYMTPQSLRFPVPTLALNLFFLQNKINIENFHPQQHPSDSLVDFIRDSYNNLDQYGFIFHQFLLGRAMSEGKLDLEVGLYLSTFICLPVGQEVPNRRCINYESFLRMQTSSEPAMAALTKFAKSHK